MFWRAALWWPGSGDLPRPPPPHPSEHGPRPWNGVILGASLPSSKEDLSKLWERAFPPQTRVGGAGARSADVTSLAPSCPSVLLPVTLTGPWPEGWAGDQACRCPRRAEPRGVPAGCVCRAFAALSLRSRCSRCWVGLPSPPPALRPGSLIPVPLHLRNVPRPEPAPALCRRRGSGRARTRPACPAPGLGVPSPKWVPSCADGQRGCCGPVAGALVPRAGPGFSNLASCPRCCWKAL